MTKNNSLEVLDENVIDSLYSISGNDLLIREVVSLFIDAAQGLFLKFEAAREAKDFETMTSVAHRFKGSAGNFGAMLLSQIAGNLENKLISRDAGCLDKETLQTLKSAYETTIQELRRRNLN